MLVSYHDHKGARTELEQCHLTTDEHNPSPDNNTDGAATPETGTSKTRRQAAIMLLLVGAICAGMGQTIIFSVLPSLAREIGISDLMTGVIFMTSAVFWVFLGPRWGRISDRHGRKPFIPVSYTHLTLPTKA